MLQSTIGQYFGNGTTPRPGIAFASDIDTGFYLPASNCLGVATSGIGVACFNSNGSLSLGGTPTNNEIFFTNHIESNNSATLYNHNHTYNIAPTIGNSNYYYFSFNNTSFNATHEISGGIYGPYTQITKSNKGKIATVIGTYDYILNNSSGYIENAYANFVTIYGNSTSGIISSAFGTYISVNGIVNSSITNAYGVYIANVAGSSNQYGLWVNPSVPNYMAGTLQIGSNVNGQGTLFVSAEDGVTCQTNRLNTSQMNITAADSFLNFVDSSNSVLGAVNGTSTMGMIAYNTFTGSHWTKIAPAQGRLRDLMLLESIGLPIGARPNQGQLVRTRICATHKSKAVMGVYGGTNNDGDDMVLALGTAYVLACNLSGSGIQNGDYLTSSSISGCCVLQDDDLLHNYTVAKSLVDVDWSGVPVHPLLGVQVKKIPVTLHCG